MLGSWTAYITSRLCFGSVYNGGASTIIGPELKGNLERICVLLASDMSWESKEKLTAKSLVTTAFFFHLKWHTCKEACDFLLVLVLLSEEIIRNQEMLG